MYILKKKILKNRQTNTDERTRTQDHESNRDPNTCTNKHMQY